MLAAFERKILTREALQALRPSLPGPVVFTNGVFDILHRGHVTYLARARALGSCLIVAVNSDASVRTLGKGDDRPINSQADRMALLAALESVDWVVCFGESTPVDLIGALRPDVLVKGGDYREETIVGAQEVRARGGEVVVVPLLEGHSTTSIVDRIRGR